MAHSVVPQQAPAPVGLWVLGLAAPRSPGLHTPCPWLAVLTGQATSTALAGAICSPQCASCSVMQCSPCLALCLDVGWVGPAPWLTFVLRIQGAELSIRAQPCCVPLLWNSVAGRCACQCSSSPQAVCFTLFLHSLPASVLTAVNCCTMQVSIHGNQPLPLRSTCTQPAPVILLANSTSAAPSPASGLCTRPAAGSEAPKTEPAAPLAPCTARSVASGAGFITGQAPDAPTLHQASSPPSHIHEVPPKQLLASPLAQLVPEDLGLSTVPCNPLHGTSLDGLTLTSSDSGSFSGSPCIRARGLDRTDSAPDQQPATCSQPALVAAGSLPDPLWPLPGHLPMHKSYSSELQQMLHTVLGKLPTATQPGEASRLRKGLHGRGPWLNRDLKGTLLGLFKRESRSFNGRGQAVQVAQSVTHDTHEEPAVQRAASCTTHSSSASKANKQRLPSRWSLDPDRQAEAAAPCVSSCAELTSRNTDTGSLETQGVGVADPPPFPASHLHGKPPLSSVDLSARPLLPGTAPHSPQDGSRKSNPALQRLLMSLPDLPSSTTHQWQAEVVPDSMQVKLAGSSSLKGVRRKTSFQVSRSPIASSSARRIGALISGLQDKVQEAQRYQLQARASFVRHEELSSISISAKIGAGGFGACYRALYQGAEVAIKVVHDRHGSATEVFRNAVELAVLSTLSHVNIVQARRHKEMPPSLHCSCMCLQFRYHACRLSQRYRGRLELRYTKAAGSRGVVRGGSLDAGFSAALMLQCFHVDKRLSLKSSMFATVSLSLREPVPELLPDPLRDGRRVIPWGRVRP
ncbi:protein kinase domain-containing protein [Haematococcus lacustris]|uniref:Protein kinase domain-containing protein n=1 Tax=Haematococcus lacustris TaxID=44745 RepID=A0A6A0A539_HAELA|nr:protein kinase domain-containing protein [Haematococcus lacustris]